MLRALGIVTDNIDSGRMIGTAAGLAVALLAVHGEARRKR